MTEGRVVFLLALVAYLVVGVRLAFFADVIHGDALSRVGNAYYTLFSRDPHLAAVGFVWNPLPSLVLIPFLPLKFLWPDLTRIGFIGNIESAVFMAAAVAVLRGCLTDMRVRRDTRLVITVLFAVHPLILVHGGYGTTEGMFVFFLLLACRYLMRWFDDDSLGGLIGAGFALGAAYMTRYEAVGAGFAAVAVVAVVAYRRALGARKQRRRIAFAETCVVAIPFGFSMAAWAGTSWLIVGSPFATLTSQYGASSQIKYGQEGLVAAYGGDNLATRAELVIRQLFALEPFVFLVVVIAVLLAWRRGDSRIWAILTPLGGTAGFMFLSLSSGRLFPFLRYSIAVIPLTALLVGYLFSAPLRKGRATAEQNAASDPAQALLYALPLFLSIVVLGTGLFGAVHGITHGLGTEEAAPLRALISTRNPSNNELWGPGYFQHDRAVARYLDSLDLPDGAVLSDVAFSYAIVLTSENPRQFVVTSDLDFDQAVADPVQFRVGYVLVPSPRMRPVGRVQSRCADLLRKR